MTIRTITLTGALLVAALAPTLAQEATLPPHSLDFDKAGDVDGIINYLVVKAGAFVDQGPIK